VAFRAVVNRAESAGEQIRLTRDYFDSLSEARQIRAA
jgi:tRNA-dihydrouridine synthase B